MRPVTPTEGRIPMLRSAPEKKKNSIKMGGVNPSTILKMASESLERFTNRALMAMAERSSESPNILERPTVSAIIAMAMESRFPLLENHFTRRVRSTPMAAPSKRARMISRTGVTRVSQSGLVPVAPRAFTAAREMPKSIRAMASSMATTGMRVSVTGPSGFCQEELFYYRKYFKV